MSTRTHAYRHIRTDIRIPFSASFFVRLNLPGVGTVIPSLFIHSGYALTAFTHASVHTDKLSFHSNALAIHLHLTIACYLFVFHVFKINLPARVDLIRMYSLSLTPQHPRCTYIRVLGPMLYHPNTSQQTLTVPLYTYTTNPFSPLAFLLTHTLVPSTPSLVPPLLFIHSFYTTILPVFPLTYHSSPQSPSDNYPTYPGYVE